jgi:hypothetical protein
VTRVLSKSQSIAAAFLAAAVTAAAGWAVVVPQAPQQRLLFTHPDVTYGQIYLAGDALVNEVGAGRFAALGVRPEATQIDLRTGRFATLYPGVSLLPGNGVGNQLTWDALGSAAPQSERELELAAEKAFRGYLERHSEELGIDLAEVASPSRVAVVDKDYIQIHSTRLVGGRPVLGSFLQASIRYGNLVLLGAINWGDVDSGLAPALSAEQAKTAVANRIAPADLGATWKGSNLAWVPVSREAELDAAAIGTGLDYRLVWVVRPKLGDPMGKFEAWVDARNGDVLALRDLKHYVATQRAVKGGVFPISNDGFSPNGIPDGVEQPGWPMPFANVTVGTSVVPTDQGGNLLSCADGNISSALSGPYLRMNDLCGAVSLTSAADLDFGASAGNNCTTPGFGGAGNTHSSRTGFFELGQLQVMARSQLPANDWLQTQITANMNINDSCNAFWDGSGVNFYRDLGLGCRNTGEIAGIFDHEWGHGMDDNDANGSILNTGGEGIADIYANLRLSDSCVGRGFDSANAGCFGYGNPCIDPPGPKLICSGVRDADWANRQLNVPTTLTSIASCGGEVHCVGFLNAETVWDLWNRDLTAGTFNYSRNLAREIATQLTYRGAGGVNNWWSGAAPFGGCAGDSGYQNYLVADDDNGSLADGTPHMQAIFDAFNRHQIACATPAVTTAGCAGAPSTAPTVTGTPQDKSVDLSWTAVGGASTYRVYRTDGLYGCEFGKTLVAEVAGLSFTDNGLQNDRTYSYQIEPMGSADECFGTVISSCTQVTPTSAGVSAILNPLGNQATLALLAGDGDIFLDNCEVARVQVPLANIGTLPLTNVRITGATVTSAGHGATTFVTTFPEIVDSSFVTCEPAIATVDFIPQGLDPGETFSVEITLDADELASPQTTSFDFNLVEWNLQFFASKSFTFEANTDGWVVEEGTFNRTSANGGGAGGAGTFYLQSSANLDEQCDVVRSPVVRLASTSTLVASTNFRTETFDGAEWWDRANLGLVHAVTGARTLISPSSGRTYNASGPNGVCGTEGQAGWAGLAPSWAASNWSAAALQAPTFAGQAMRLQMRYGTDPFVNDTGFRFDDLTLTNVESEVADTQSNSCVPSNLIFADGFGTGNTQEWTLVFP